MAKYITATCVILLCFSSCKSNLFDVGETIGDTVIELQFNLINYLDPSQKELVYGEDPQIPGDGGVTEIESPAKTIDITDEIGDVKSIESVNLFVGYDMINESGWANLQYIVYFSEVGEDPFSVPGIFSEKIELRPQHTTNGGLTISADERLKGLFEKKKFQYAAKLRFETQSGSGPLLGKAVLNEFKADIVLTI